MSKVNLIPVGAQLAVILRGVFLDLESRYTKLQTVDTRIPPMAFWRKVSLPIAKGMLFFTKKINKDNISKFIEFGDSIMSDLKKGSIDIPANPKFKRKDINHIDIVEIPAYVRYRFNLLNPVNELEYSNGIAYIVYDVTNRIASMFEKFITEL